MPRNIFLKRIDFFDDLGDPLDRRYRLDRIALDALYFRGDVLGGALRLPGEFLDFVGHDGEPLSRLSGACRFDGGVEREKVRLLGNDLDDGGHLADFFGAFSKLVHDLAGFRCGFRGLFGDRCALLRVRGHALDRAGHFLKGLVYTVHIGRHFIGGRGKARHARANFLRRGGDGPDVEDISSAALTIVAMFVDICSEVVAVEEELFEIS